MVSKIRKPYFGSRLQFLSPSAISNSRTCGPTTLAGAFSYLLSADSDFLSCLPFSLSTSECLYGVSIYCFRGIEIQ